ncbi:MAG: hypothetical protein JWO08_2455 [Verrucomicrobiaceae bacterium]|nr:hypothetical protein [Verrucomicrobiaceae bacterium]
MKFRVLLLLGITTVFGFAADAGLSGYQPLSGAVTAKMEPSKASSDGLTGYLGVSLEDRPAGLAIAEVAPASPAANAGLQTGDVMVSLDGQPLHNASDARTLLQAQPPGRSVSLELKRNGKSQTVKATLTATSSPMKTSSRVVLGVRMGEPLEDGIPILSVTKDQPADKAGLRVGDVILSVDGADLGEARLLADVLSEKKADSEVKIVIRRKQQEMVKTAVLAAISDSGLLSDEERRELKIFKKPAFRIAVVPIDFSDVKHSSKIQQKDWEEAFFSRGTYNKTNALNQTVYGSMNDYYQETSCGKMSITGKVFNAVTAAKAFAVYSQLKARGSAKGGLLMEVMDTLLERDGDHALDGFDGIGFIYAGEKGRDISRGNIFWPHRSSFRRNGKLWSYVIIPELKNGNMSNISTMCHETGHSLGLPDLYARPENPGSEGTGRWCIMSNQATNGRPQHFSAWSKEQLGWLTPVVIDPGVKQKLILGPVEGSTTECLKVLVRRDGSEYLLLENRRKTGFDASLPAEGLLIWRVVNNRPILEESHGITGPSGPRVFLPSVPYPSKANTSFTPFTIPSSRSQLGGGLPVFISNIRQLDEGRVALDVGYEFE